ncbi:MAG: homoserine O-acetyltransferase [Cyclobacteriaceae bacterium]
MLSHKTFSYKEAFTLESGRKLPELQLFYTTYGKLAADKSNVVWVCHAFSGSSDFTDWWPGLFGAGKMYDPADYFIICANMPGGCYGSTGPLSVNPETGKPFFHDFPLLTNRDIIHAFDLLRQYLGIDKIHTVIGCSLGGQQAVEWAVTRPEVFNHLISIGSNASHSPWAIAFNETQRMAIEADSTWVEKNEKAGLGGMKAARAVGLLSYRNSIQYNKSQGESSDDVFDNFRASSYQKYQGEKLAKRFNAFTYWYLSKAMDSQNVGRNRGGISKALARIVARSIFIGITTDILFPQEEQQFMADHVKNATFEAIESDYGHDGFLIEYEKLELILRNFYKATNAKTA